MRKLIAAILAVPVLALVIVGSIIRRVEGRRPLVGATLGLAVLLAVAALAAGALRPTPATGTRPSRASAVPATEFATEIRTGTSPVAPISVSFPTSMDPASVEQLLRVDPATAVTLSWDATDSVLIVTPVTVWSSDTVHTVTVESGALDATGRPLDRRIQAVFVTRAPLSAAITPTIGAANDAGIGTAFRITFNGPVDASTLAVVVDPVVAGSIRPVGDSTGAAPAFDFVPDVPLQADTAYTVSLGAGVRDADGAPIAAAPTTVRTAAAPTVVRFRPLNGTSNVAWSQDLSVRFTEPMDRASTQAAWSAVQGNTPIAGTFSWSEHDTVMVFNPKAALGYKQTIKLTVGVGATSKAGLALAKAASATITTAPKPVARPTISSPSVGGSTWAAVEHYYLGLMNCTRTGGWVTSTGTCSSPGGRAVAPLWQDAGISTKVSRPYARKLAVYGLCTHFSGGTPGTRLSAAGYTSWNWAENIGCPSGDPYKGALAVQLFFQSEKSYNGGHYVNLMNALYDRVGIGVWVYSGRVRIVIDFYRPL